MLQSSRNTHKVLFTFFEERVTMTYTRNFQTQWRTGHNAFPVVSILLAEKNQFAYTTMASDCRNSHPPCPTDPTEASLSLSFNP
jgi:hypothetical protein